MNDRPRVEFDLPGTTTADLRGWGERIEVENPISSGSTRFTPYANLVVTDEPFGGVELTFMVGERAVFTLAIFATHLTEKEKQIMESGQ